jgi:Spy/CpxP family protein refolding chaperone
MEKPDSSPDSLKAMNRSLADLKFDRRMEFRAMRQDLRAVLTPEQREKAARMEGRMEGMRMARGGWGMRGEGGMRAGGGMGQCPMGSAKDGCPMCKPGMPAPPAGTPAQ